MRSRLRVPMLVLVSLLLLEIVAGVPSVAAYTPKAGDSFNFTESITVNNGQGSYTGYTDQTSVTGYDMMKSVAGTNVLASYSYSSSFSNNQGAGFTNSSTGDYTWSAGSYQYVNGTDNQVGYSKPTYVWFAMNPDTPLNGTFYVLNTQFVVLSKNFSFQLLGNGSRWVQAIRAEGSGQYQRHDSYGTFTASYTWDEYFDPTTGYIEGYNYVEQDNGQYNGQAGSFTYTDNLYVVTTSYTLAPANPGTVVTTSGSFEIGGVSIDALTLGLILGVIVIGVAAYAAIRIRRREPSLPQHSPVPSSPSSPAPWESKVDLGSQPTQQVVIRDVAKVNCRFCGTLIPTTADTCPYCGGPRR